MGAQGRWRGRGASRSGSGHHACSVQATSRAQSGAQRGIIFFAATEVRILPARHIEQPAASFSPLRPHNARRNPCRSCTLAMPRLGREPSLLRRFAQIGINSLETRADFDPNGFRSSSLTTPATQSVSATPSARCQMAVRTPVWAARFCSTRWRSRPGDDGVTNEFPALGGTTNPRCI
jgi:hypothetical protein